MNILLDILWFMQNLEIISSSITRKVLNEKILYYSVLKSFRDKLQEYVQENIGFHLRN